jgi:hypothetical protein
MMHNGPAVEQVFCVGRIIRASHHSVLTRSLGILPGLLMMVASASFSSPTALYLPLLRQGYEEPSHNLPSTHGHNDHRSTLIHAKADMARYAGGVLTRRAAHDHGGTSTLW